MRVSVICQFFACACWALSVALFTAVPITIDMLFCECFFSSRRRHTRCALVTGVQTCALPILLLAEHDGSEISTANLEEKIDLAKKVEESAGAFEIMRDVAAANYIRETGRSWVPSSGNRISLGVTAGIVDGHAFLRARRERALNANTAQGTPVVFAGGRLTFANEIGRAHV